MYLPNLSTTDMILNMANFRVKYCWFDFGVILLLHWMSCELGL